MTKGEQIKDFLKTNTIVDKKLAYEAFIKSTKIDVSFARFDYIWKTEGTSFSPGITTPVTSQVREKVKLVKISDIHYPDSILVPFKSNTPLDILASEQGGILPATITVSPGTSGVGKSTVWLEHLGNVKKQHKKARLLFISTEMNDIHLYKYSKRIKFDGVEIMLLGDYENPAYALEDVLKEGWDVILLDSFQDCVDKLVGAGLFRSTQAESWLLNQMDKTRKGENDLNLYTSFICIQHMTKGGEYAGSSKLKHMTDAMVMFKFDELEEPFIEYEKNRDGAVKKKLYFKIINGQGTVFNEHRFKQDEENKQEVSKVREQMTQKNSNFDEFFNLTVSSPEEQTM